MLELFLVLTMLTADQGQCNQLTRVPMGCFDVPCDYKVARAGGEVDYWFGYVEPPSGEWRVYWFAGLVTDFLEPHDGRDVISIKTLELGDRKMDLGRVQEGAVDLLVLRAHPFFLMQFTTTSDTPKAEQILRKVALSLRPSAGLDCEPAELDLGDWPYN